MRRAAGDPLALFNASEGEFAATIGRFNRGGAEILLGERVRLPEIEQNCVLCFAPVKRDATNLIVEKATEIGATAIQPVLTARSQTARINAERLAAIATEAAEQCERLSVPEIRPIVTLDILLRDWPDSHRLFVAAERRDLPPLGPFDEQCGLLIGPEGGYAPLELDVLARHPLVTLVSLGPRILRAETAAIAGLARLLAGNRSI